MMEPAVMVHQFAAPGEEPRRLRVMNVVWATATGKQVQLPNGEGAVPAIATWCQQSIRGKSGLCHSLLGKIYTESENPLENTTFTLTVFR